MSTLSEALRLYQDGQYDEAAKRLRILTEFDPDNPQPWLYYGACLGQLGRWGQAADAYRRVVELLPEEVSAYCDLAEALLQAGRLEQAEDAVLMALSLAPDHPVALDLRHRLAVAAPKPPPGIALPADPDTSAPPPRPARRRPTRLHVLLGILGLLLCVVAWRLTQLPTARWQPLRDAARLLDLAEAEREKLAGMPGEDLEQVSRMRDLLSAAEVRLYPIRGIAASPDAGYLRGRLYWCRDRDRFAARNELQDALSRLAALPPRQRRPLGLTVAELQAASYRLLARIELSPGGTLSRAADWAKQAKAAAPSRDDAALAAELEAARRARQ